MANGFWRMPLFFDQGIIIAIDRVYCLSGVHEASDSKTENYFEEIPGCRFEFLHIFFTNLFHFLSQVIVDLLHLFDILFLSVSWFLCGHTISFLLLGILRFIVENDGRKGVFFSLDFLFFNELFRFFFDGISQFGILPLESQFVPFDQFYQFKFGRFR